MVDNAPSGNRISRWEVAWRVYRASRGRGWSRRRSARWGVGAWRRHPNGMDLTTREIPVRDA